MTLIIYSDNPDIKPITLEGLEDVSPRNFNKKDEYLVNIEPQTFAIPAIDVQSIGHLIYLKEFEKHKKALYGIVPPRWHNALEAWIIDSDMPIDKKNL